ncbi:transglycosylase [Canicola haemoglobinophilus]|nr:transglycosylase [Canicola haemoglobinophilus]
MVRCQKNLPLLAQKRYFTNLKYGYARGYEAFQYVENIRRYMNSIVNYQRVQQSQQEQQNSDTPSTKTQQEQP